MGGLFTGGRAPAVSQDVAAVSLGEAAAAAAIPPPPPPPPVVAAAAAAAAAPDADPPAAPAAAARTDPHKEPNVAAPAFRPPPTSLNVRWRAGAEFSSLWGEQAHVHRRVAATALC